MQYALRRCNLLLLAARYRFRFCSTATAHASMLMFWSPGKRNRRKRSHCFSAARSGSTCHYAIVWDRARWFPSSSSCVTAYLQSPLAKLMTRCLSLLLLLLPAFPASAAGSSHTVWSSFYGSGAYYLGQAVAVAQDGSVVHRSDVCQGVRFQLPSAYTRFRSRSCRRREHRPVTQKPSRLY